MARKPVRINWRGPQVVAAVRQSAADGLNAGAIMLRSIMSAGMRKARGLVTVRRGRRNRYRAAPPGSYPGVRTGNLVRSLAVRLATPVNLNAAAGVSLKAPNIVRSYALWLEFGTSRMRARPWAYRSYAENRARIRSTVVRASKVSLARLLARIPGGGAR